MDGEAESGAGASGDMLALIFLDADAAVASGSGGVDAIDTVGVVEDGGNGGVAQEIGFELGEAAVVGEGDAFDVAGGLR